jgi:hypothetical protein
MTTVENLEELKDYFHRGTLMFTDDAEERGIDNRLIPVGLRLDMAMSRRDMDMWYLKRGETDLVRYHPVTSDMPFQAIVSEGLGTRVDFLAGEAPLIYDVCESILDAGFRVGVPNMGGTLQDIALFKKQGDLYVREKVIEL